MNRRTIVIVVAVVAVIVATATIPALRHTVAGWLGFGQATVETVYVCPMHPEVRSHEPGECPECGMHLVAETPAPAGAEGDVAFYTCTMHPSVHESEPGRCPICNMDLVPVMKNAATETGEVDLTFHVSNAKQQLVGVTFAVAERRDVHKVIAAYGLVDYDETRLSVVNLRVGGWIDKLFVDFTGRHVRKGEPLFLLYSPDLVSAQSEYLLAHTSTHATTGSYAQSLVETARERLRLWQITDEQVQELERSGKPLTSIPIVAPVSGFVVEKMVVEGMRVEPDMALYRIADLSTLWLQADVYESDLRFVKVGQPATVTLPAQGIELQGKVSYIDPVLNPATRAARVRVALDNHDGALKPDMYANVELHVDLGERLVVPESAVLRTGERQIVFVDQGNGIFEMRLVKLGARARGFYEILEGIAEGERVVSSANFLIDAESRVQGVLKRLEGDTTTTAPPEHRH